MHTLWTIDGLEEMTEQEIFDMSAKHIGTTRKQSLGSLDRCVYSGSGCGAAPFLKEKFRGRADARGVWPALVRTQSAPSKHDTLITQLQLAHDGSMGGDGFVSHWKKLMREVAEKFALSDAVIDTIPD